MLAEHFLSIRATHVSCVALSGLVFTARGLLRLNGHALANARPVRWLSYAIDTILLASAVLLSIILGQYPLIEAWLTAKITLLGLYIFLGVLALRRARSRFGSALAFVLALLTFATIIGVAVTHEPRSWQSLLLHPHG